MEQPRPADYEGVVQTYDPTQADIKNRYTPLIGEDGKKIRVQMWLNKDEPKDSKRPHLKGRMTLPDGTEVVLSLWEK